MIKIYFRLIFPKFAAIIKDKDIKIASIKSELMPI